MAEFSVEREICRYLESSGGTCRIVDRISVAACLHSNHLEQVEDAPAVILGGHEIFGKLEFWSCSVTPIWTLTMLSSNPSLNPVRQK